MPTNRMQMTRTVSVSAMELLLSYTVFLFVPSLYIYLRHISDAVSIEKTVIKSRSVAAGTPNPDPTRPHYMHVCMYAQLYRGETS